MSILKSIVLLFSFIIFTNAKIFPVKPKSGVEHPTQNNDTTFFDLSPEEYKLTDNVVPLDYKLSIRPNFTANTFEGKVTILVKPNVAGQRSITLHSKGLKIKSDWEIQPEGIPAVLPKGPLQEDPDTDTVKFLVQQALELRFNYTLSIEYSGVMDAHLNGLFRSNYKSQGSDHSSYATSLTPISARKLFPCFDEPRFKSKFRLSIKDIGEYSVISNGAEPFIVDEQDEKEEEGKV